MPTDVVKPPPLYDLAAYAVVVIWSIVASIATITGDYTGLQLVTPVMLVLAGALFVIRNGRNGKGQ